MRTKTMHPALVALVAASLVLAAACGGTDSPPPPEPTTPSAAAPPAAQAPPAAAAQQAPPLTPEQMKDAPLPAGHPPVAAPAAGAPQIAAPPPGAGTGATGMNWTVPAGWVSETPSSSMRKAQYRVSGPGGDGECAVFYFGPNQGGDPMSNAARWAGQFKQPDGKSPEQAMKTSLIQVQNFPVLMVETTGTYTGGMTMGMKPAEDKPGYALLGAVAQGPDSNWFFKFTGPEKTVNAQRAAFDAMIKSLKKGA